MSYDSSRTSFTQHLAAEAGASTFDGSTRYLSINSWRWCLRRRILFFSPLRSRSHWSASGDSSRSSLAGRERTTPSETLTGASAISHSRSEKILSSCL
uniref:Uncharacterized protein n=1 Tax=Setaria italica TaxID=4555 RepID=K3ZB58_SETIT